MKRHCAGNWRNSSSVDDSIHTNILLCFLVLCMTNSFCCENQSQLRNNGYVHNGLVYLQRLDVETDLPVNLRLYNFCIMCGTPANQHHDDINIQCVAFKKGITEGKFGLMANFDRNAIGNQYIFNLDRHEKISIVSVGHPNYPEPTHLHFCPYCGRAIN